MIDEDFGSFLKCVFGKDGTVGGNFKCQLIVVGFLIYAEVFNGVLNIRDGCVDGVDGDDMYVVDSDGVLVGGSPTTALVDGKVN